MKLIYVIIGTLLLLSAGLARNALVYSPESEPEITNLLKQEGYSVTVTKTLFDIPKAMQHDIVIIEGLSRINHDSYIVAREYANRGGKVVLTIIPNTVTNNIMFRYVQKPNEMFCYTEPSASARAQHCFEASIIEQETKGNLQTVYSTQTPYTNAVVLEGTPIAYVGGKKAAVRTLTNNGEMITVGFQYSEETSDFFRAIVTGREPIPLPDPSKTGESDTVIPIHGPKHSGLFDPDKTMTGQATSKQWEERMLPMAIFTTAALAAIIYTLTKKGPAEKPPEEGSEEYIEEKPVEKKTEQSIIEQIVPEEKDEFIY